MGDTNYSSLGKKYRRDILQMAIAGGRGHIGPAFSLVEIISVLFEKVLRFDTQAPHWADRDRLILSKGHGCMALYAALGRKGFFPIEEFNRFCKPGGILGGHPDHRLVPGVEHSTGALGHGLSFGMGIAEALRLDKKNSRVFVILGDGECNEGSIWEAALHAAKHKLENLIVLIDYNKMQSFGPTSEILNLEPFAEKWRAFGFETREVDMDYPQKLEDLLLAIPFSPGRPSALICHTTKGKGVTFMENNSAWHHRGKLTEEEVAAMLEELAD